MLHLGGTPLSLYPLHQSNLTLSPHFQWQNQVPQCTSADLMCAQKFSFFTLPYHAVRYMGSLYREFGPRCFWGNRPLGREPEHWPFSLPEDLSPIPYHALLTACYTFPPVFGYPRQVLFHSSAELTLWIMTFLLYPMYALRALFWYAMYLHAPRPGIKQLMKLNWAFISTVQQHTVHETEPSPNQLMQTVRVHTFSKESAFSSSPFLVESWFQGESKPSDPQGEHVLQQDYILWQSFLWNPMWKRESSSEPSTCIYVWTNVWTGVGLSSQLWVFWCVCKFAEMHYNPFNLISCGSCSHLRSFLQCVFLHAARWVFGLIDFSGIPSTTHIHMFLMCFCSIFLHDHNLPLAKTKYAKHSKKA